ncbi:hypothetical protein ACFL2M_01745 [Patescibacteria group bacterium]
MTFLKIFVTANNGCDERVKRNLPVEAIVWKITGSGPITHASQWRQLSEVVCDEVLHTVFTEFREDGIPFMPITDVWLPNRISPDGLCHIWLCQVRVDERNFVMVKPTPREDDADVIIECCIRRDAALAAKATKQLPLLPLVADIPLPRELAPHTNVA